MFVLKVIKCMKSKNNLILHYFQCSIVSYNILHPFQRNKSCLLTRFFITLIQIILRGVNVTVSVSSGLCFDGLKTVLNSDTCEYDRNNEISQNNNRNNEISRKQ